MANIAAYYNGEAVAPAQDITGNLFDAFVKWLDRSPKTTKTYLENLKQFGAWMQLEGISSPQREDITSYRAYLEGKGCKPTTIASYLRSVKQFFNWTAASGIYPDIAQNIRIPKIDRSTHKKDCLTPEEVLTVEQSIADTAAQKTTDAAGAVKDKAGRVQRSMEQGKRLTAIYLLAVNTGLRTVEISRANVKDFETKGGKSWLYIWGKGHTEPDQRKPLAPEVAAAIADYLQTRSDNPTGSSPLFVSTGNRSKGKRIATTTISTMLKKAMQEAGFNSERITAHSLRHTCGTAFFEISGDLYKTQSYMRHANPATTEIYLHADTEEEEAALAQQLYNVYHGKQQETGSRDLLEASVEKLSPDQLDQLAAIAAAMAN